MQLSSLLDVPGDADTRRRARTMLSIAFLLFGLNLLRTPIGLLIGISPAQTLPATLVGLVGLGLPILIARRGHVEIAGWIVVVGGTLTVSTLPVTQGELVVTIVFLMLPVLFASLTMRPLQIWASMALALAALGFCVSVTGGRIGIPESAAPLLIVTVLLVVMVAVLGFIGARATARVFAEAAAARGHAELLAAALGRLNARLEADVATRTTDLRTALADVEARANEQQRLLDEVATQRHVIHELSVPVLPVRAGVLVMPLIGALDSARLHDLQAQALEAIERNRAHTLLLDITGVPMVDTQVAQGLIQTIAAARLLGAEPVLIGVRPEVAQTLVSLGIDLRSVHTAADLASALR